MWDHPEVFLNPEDSCFLVRLLYIKMYNIIIPIVCLYSVEISCAALSGPGAEAVSTATGPQ